MPNDALRMTVLLPASPDEVYNAWLDPTQHGEFTGSPAEVEAVVGGAHSAWDGYITGKIVELEPGKRIVQSWRTTEFPVEAGDSRLALTLTAVDGGTELLLEHLDIPEGQGHAYEQGWVEYYFEPMKKHFGKNARHLSVVPELEPEPEPVKKAAPRKAAKKPAKKAAAKKAVAKKKPAKKAAAKKATKKVAKKVAKKKPAKKAKKKAGKRR